MRLSEHFDLSEFTTSQEAVRIGIDNTPDEPTIGKLVALCNSVLEPIRDLVDVPLIISSGFRCLQLNRAIRSNDDSQHIKGEAADFYSTKMTVQDMFDMIRSSNVPYDQLIQEHNRWIHASYKPNPRRQAMYATLEHGKTIYEPA
jgi:hypothetical protein